MSEPTWSFSQSFATEFQTARTDLQTRIDAIKESATPSQTQDVLNDLSISLSKLSKSLSDATPSLPTYDQRQYNQQLKALELSVAELRTKAVPKSKFAFKRKAANPASSTPSPASSTPVKESSPPVPQTQPTVQTKNVTLSSQSNKVLNWESIPAFSGRSDITITDLSRCIVDLVSAEGSNSAGQDALAGERVISAIHIDNLRDTLLILPVVEGSVLVHSLARCTIAVGCQQFRMHNSNSVNVYLYVPSNPVIEQCDEIRFAEYPESLAPVSNEQKPSKHHEVLDFSHILSTPSPHWSVLSEDQKITTWNNRKQKDEGLNAYLP